MGGEGSGSWRDRGAGRCEAHCRLDLAELRRIGALRPGKRSTLSWSSEGERVGRIELTARHESCRLVYRARVVGGDWEAIDETIRFVETPLNFGGSRRWFACPGCGRRCRILYAVPLFRCRRCHELTYHSQYVPDWERAWRKAERLHARLGGSGDVSHPFPPKPARMHWTTYRRLREVYEAL